MFGSYLVELGSVFGLGEWLRERVLVLLSIVLGLVVCFFLMFFIICMKDMNDVWVVNFSIVCVVWIIYSFKLMKKFLVVWNNSSVFDGGNVKRRNLYVYYFFLFVVLR